MPVLDLVTGGGDSDGGPCQPWASIEDVDCGPCATYDFDPMILEDVLEAASYILFMATRQRFPGICTATVRPPARCSCEDSCGCGRVSEIVLDGYPVVGVDEVLIDGEPLPASRYRVDNFQRLVYVRDPAAPSTPRSGWPSRQLGYYPPDQEGTWQVTYRFGAAPPPGGKRAAIAYGCQLALACASGDDCRLPQDTVNLVQQGLTLAMRDPDALLDNGRTGIKSVDDWVVAVNTPPPASGFVPGNRPRSRYRTS